MLIMPTVMKVILTTGMEMILTSGIWDRYKPLEWRIDTDKCNVELIILEFGIDTNYWNEIDSDYLNWCLIPTTGILVLY